MKNSDINIMKIKNFSFFKCNVNNIWSVMIDWKKIPTNHNQMKHLYGEYIKNSHKVIIKTKTMQLTFDRRTVLRGNMWNVT
jgi:hypothetical protein